MKRSKKLNFAQKKCVSLAGLAMQRTGQIHPGARVGVAVSGGVDSFVLLQVLMLRRKIVPFDFEIMALHINPGFEPESHAPLTQWCATNGIPLHAQVCSIGPDAHTEINKKDSPCFYCSWHRRKMLFDMTKKYNLTHLAFGHNNDDLVVNFFMNIFQVGKVHGMDSRAEYFGGEMTMIRPLILVDKEFIRKAAKAWNLPIWANVCPSNGATKRSEFNEWLESTWHDKKWMKKNVFNAIGRWQLDLDTLLP